MEADASVWSLNVAVGVLLVDILLSGDNAIVIALVCRSLSKQHRSKALWLGVLGAFGARLLLTGVATLAMNLPLIKLIGGLLLLKISIDLIVDNAGADGSPVDAQDSTAGDIFAAARTIILADIVMSLDNVVALSAVSQNNFQMLMAGLLLSIPILMFGSLYISRLLDVFPQLLWVGGAILGGVSGALIIDDPIFGGAFSSASSLSNLVVPVIAALFVLQMSRVIAANVPTMAALQKPRSLLDILWKSAAQAPLAQGPQPAARQAEPVAIAQAFASTTSSTRPAQALHAAPGKPKLPAGVPPAGGEHRLVIALGLFMVLSGSAIYYLLNAYEAPAPDVFFTYFCKEPALSIRFRPSAQQIRLSNPKGSVTAKVVEDRIVWEDDREAGARLALALPVKIVQADANKLVLHGGAFDNTACLVAAQR